MATPWSDVISLIPLEEGLNENGFPAIVEGEPRDVFASKMSIYTNEHYQAKASGIELEYKFKVRSFEYEGEERVKFNDKKYDVERTFEEGEFVELTLKRRSDDHAN